MLILVGRSTRRITWSFSISKHPAHEAPHLVHLIPARHEVIALYNGSFFTSTALQAIAREIDWVPAYPLIEMPHGPKLSFGLALGNLLQELIPHVVGLPLYSEACHGIPPFWLIY